MVRYKVTTEIKTALWKKILRWFKIIPKLPVFTLILNADFRVGHVLYGGQGKVKILKVLKDE